MLIYHDDVNSYLKDLNSVFKLKSISQSTDILTLWLLLMYFAACATSGMRPKDNKAAPSIFNFRSRAFQNSEQPVEQK